MLREIKNVRQERAPGRRRWFESDQLDLIVWLDQAERMIGFQICYSKGTAERALTWRDGAGFAHNAIDSGSRSPVSNQTPILLPGGKAPWPHIQRIFDEASDNLEPDLRRTIRDKLEQGAAR